MFKKNVISVFLGSNPFNTRSTAILHHLEILREVILTSYLKNSQINLFYPQNLNGWLK